MFTPLFKILTLLLALAAITACGAITENGKPASSDGGSSNVEGADGGSAEAEAQAPWKAPEVPEDLCTSSADCQTGYFCTTEKANNPECLAPPECNAQDAACAGVCYGRCAALEEPPCACDEAWAPVCGADGATYANQCLAACAGAEIAADGECPPASASPCVSSEECAAGFHCSVEDGDCLPVCAPYGSAPGDCLEVCGGACVPSSGGPLTCLSNADCAPDEQCIFGETQACLPPPGCTDANACPDVCAGICLPREEQRICYSSADCSAGESCSVEQGDCRPPPGCDSGNACPGVCAGICLPSGCPCPEIYFPVCGADGNTYSSECVASCAGAPVAYEGECDACEIACGVADPVCGADGRTYWCGEPEAACHGVPVSHRGECGSLDDCAAKFCAPGATLVSCTDDFGPDGCPSYCECATEGQLLCRSSYECPAAQICSLDLGRPDCFTGSVLTLCFGECLGAEELDCRLCPRLYAPVCTADGRKFDNRCFAYCSGVKEFEDCE